MAGQWCDVQSSVIEIRWLAWALKFLFFTAELKFMITTNFFQDDGGFSEIEDDSSSSSDSDSDASDISVDKNDVDIENDRRKSSTAKVVETKKQV